MDNTMRLPIQSLKKFAADTQRLITQQRSDRNNVPALHSNLVPGISAVLGTVTQQIEVNSRG
jgi:hypothetical protein